MKAYEYLGAIYIGAVSGYGTIAFLDLLAAFQALSLTVGLLVGALVVVFWISSTKLGEKEMMTHDG